MLGRAFRGYGMGRCWRTKRKGRRAHLLSVCLTVCPRPRSRPACLSVGSRSRRTRVFRPSRHNLDSANTDRSQPPGSRPRKKATRHNHDHRIGIGIVIVIVIIIARSLSPRDATARVSIHTWRGAVLPFIVAVASVVVLHTSRCLWPESCQHHPPTPSPSPSPAGAAEGTAAAAALGIDWTASTIHHSARIGFIAHWQRMA